MKILKIISIFLFIASFLFLFPQKILAVSYDLIPPSGDLSRGQEVQFTISIDTQSKSLTSTQIGMTYDTKYLQYVSSTPGDAMSSVTVADQGGGKLVFTGSNPQGFTGTGTFAYVNFKIIAAASGSTQLCVLFAPSPTPAPTGPVPTELPKTGNMSEMIWAAVGTFFVVTSTSYFLLSRRARYSVKQK